MKKSIIYLVTILILIISPMILLTSFVFVYPDYYEKAYSRGIVLQYNYLKETQNEDRIIFVGTSALTFGLDEQEVEDRFGKTVVSFGIYGAMGNSVIFEWSEDFIHEGDTVIFLYDIYERAMHPFFGENIVLEGTYRNIEMFSKLSSKEKAQVLAALPNYLDKCIHRYREDQRLGDTFGAYTIDNFNEKGWFDAYRPFNRMQNGYVDEGTFTHICPDIIDEEYTAIVNKWATGLKNKGAKVLFTYGPVNELIRQAESTDEDGEAFMKEWEKQIGIESITSINENYFPSEYFYDENFHMNNEGEKFFTSYLIRKTEIALYGSTDYPLYEPKFE